MSTDFPNESESNTFTETQGHNGLEEEDLGDTQEDVWIEPFDPKRVDIQVTQSIMDAIIKRLKNNDIELSPDFQRSGDLWKKSNQARLIESLLINLPIPAFYFDATNDDSWQIVDGLQRLSTIKNFVIDKTLKLTGLEFLSDYNDASFDDLPRTLQRRIEEFPVTLYLIKPGTPVKMKYSLFHRINTGGLTLKPQEIRHAIGQGINAGQASKFLKSLSDEKAFSKVVSSSGIRMSNQELILRHIAFVMEGVESYKSSMVKFLDTAMEKLGEFNNEELGNLRKGFLSAMNTAWFLFDEHAFRKSFVEPARIKVVNKPLFEALSVPLAKLSDEENKILRANKILFLEEFRFLMLDERFQYSISTSTANTENVLHRFGCISSLVNKYKRM